MSIKITIPNTSSDVLTFGSANTPTAAQIAGIDSGSSNGQLALYTTASGTSTERVRVDASGNVGIGTSSPSYKLQIGDSTVVATNRLVFGKAVAASETNLPVIGQQSATGAGNDLAIAATSTSSAVRFFTGASTNSGEIGTGSNAERMRIDSSGNLLVGGSSFPTSSARLSTIFDGSIANGFAYYDSRTSAGTDNATIFVRGTTQVGSITTTLSATAYVTSSDYRLKENITPMTGALAKVNRLNPVTYNWKSTGDSSEGFIAHELQAVVPECVVGEKDAVDAEGNPVYQGIDTSFLVATLTAAIQEQQALITQLQADVAALKGTK